MTVLVSDTPSILRISSIYEFISNMVGATIIVAISYCPVISYTISIPLSSNNWSDTLEVSATETY